MMPTLDNPTPPLAAVLLCGGKGSRMLEQGITTHKPLLNLNGIPSTKLIIQQLLNSQLNFSQILVVVPPGREPDYEGALIGLGVKIITQHEALGTGNAVHCIIDELLSPIEQVYVSFGTQPLIRTTTIEAALAHHLASGAGFTLPTTFRKDPYAPLIRDEMGEVVGSIETHLDNAEMPTFGETNVGGYWSSKYALEIVLGKLHSNLYDDGNKRYNTNSGELGFPNEMTRGCLEIGLGVEGIAIADPEEVVGLKTPEHIGEIEQWLNKGWRR
jgi:bifunctional N-acetylglucosamine-1-phosphate-uridyltransferase/glucosamine-1-phosphate-acetyltransferase GlmU-like protein